MKCDLFNHLQEKNLDTYFFYHDLQRQRSFTSTIQWDANKELAARRNRALDEKFYDEMWKDQSYQYWRMIYETVNRPTAYKGSNRVVMPSRFNEQLDTEFV